MHLTFVTICLQEQHLSLEDPQLRSRYQKCSGIGAKALILCYNVDEANSTAIVRVESADSIKA